MLVSEDHEVAALGLSPTEGAGLNVAAELVIEPARHGD